jgi:hypothetical protein
MSTSAYFEYPDGGVSSSGESIWSGGEDLFYLGGGAVCGGEVILGGRLKYRLEFNYDETNKSDSSVYIHLKINVPVYQPRLDKEDFDVQGSGHPFLVGLFSISGVTEVSTKAYRVWLMKSPVFNWKEVLEPALYFIASSFGYTSLYQMPGSGGTDGSGFTLPSSNQRRKI